ncbi:hypothetical protein, partial [Marivirga sp.]|uniref:hypothetical protein n=1 Tax=Marivirga sp. TaxID=2018662 RepID=UPI0025E19DC9
MAVILVSIAINLLIPATAYSQKLARVAKQNACCLICLILAFPAFTQNTSNPVQITSNLIPP